MSRGVLVPITVLVVLVLQAFFFSLVAEARRHSLSSTQQRLRSSASLTCNDAAVVAASTTTCRNVPGHFPVSLVQWKLATCSSRKPGGKKRTVAALLDPLITSLNNHPSPVDNAAGVWNAYQHTIPGFVDAEAAAGSHGTAFNALSTCLLNRALAWEAYDDLTAFTHNPKNFMRTTAIEPRETRCPAYESTTRYMSCTAGGQKYRMKGIMQTRIVGNTHPCLVRVDAVSPKAMPSFAGSRLISVAEPHNPDHLVEGAYIAFDADHVQCSLLDATTTFTWTAKMSGCNVYVLQHAHDPTRPLLICHSNLNSAAANPANSLMKDAATMKLVRSFHGFGNYRITHAMLREAYQTIINAGFFASFYGVKVLGVWEFYQYPLIVNNGQLGALTAALLAHTQALPAYDVNRPNDPQYPNCKWHTNKPASWP